MPLEQEDFGGTFKGTLDEFFSCHPDYCHGIAFYHDLNPIGVALLKVPPESPEWVKNGQVSMHGLKLAPTLQGMGIGKRIFEQTLRIAASSFPRSEELILAVDEGNANAKAVYLAFNPLDSGPVYVGRIGMEHRMNFDITIFRDSSGIG
ncbi:MAG: GNAT family N-acetyltransferase [Cyanobacteria bacterium P01_F01_bin.33]